MAIFIKFLLLSFLAVLILQLASSKSKSIAKVRAGNIFPLKQEELVIYESGNAAVDAILKKRLKDISEEDLDVLSNSDIGTVFCPRMVNNTREVMVDEPYWRTFLEKFLPFITKMMHKCEEGLKKKDEDVKPMLGLINNVLDCMGDRSSINKMTIVAIVFIVAFVLALIGLAVLAFLLCRRKR